jgi:hypothetical protein
MNSRKSTPGTIIDLASLRSARSDGQAWTLCLRRRGDSGRHLSRAAGGNARRLKVPLDKFPKLVAVDAACLALPAFDRARPKINPTPSDRRRGAWIIRRRIPLQAEKKLV